MSQRAGRDGKPVSVEPSTGWFQTTHWSVVLTAGDSGLPGAEEALENLCRIYWYPLYAFVRLKGNPPEDAKDLTQAFFEHFLQKQQVKAALREKGRFRTFLLTLLTRFLCDQFDRSSAIKRGGGVAPMPLDTTDAEAQLDQLCGSCPSPETMFDRAWAETVVHNGVERLRQEYETDGKAGLFAELKPYLSRPPDRAAYVSAGQRLGMNAPTVATAVLRLRRRYRDLVRAEVANTVATPAEVDAEIRYLVNLLAR